jgi:hypothetical protein
MFPVRRPAGRRSIFSRRRRPGVDFSLSGEVAAAAAFFADSREPRSMRLLARFPDLSNSDSSPFPQSPATDSSGFVPATAASLSATPSPPAPRPAPKSRIQAPGFPPASIILLTALAALTWAAVWRNERLVGQAGEEPRPERLASEPSEAGKTVRQ